MDSRWTLFVGKKIDGGLTDNVGFTNERNSGALRKVEGARLESLCTVKGTVGSNPTLSAINLSFSILKCGVKIGLIAM